MKQSQLLEVISLATGPVAHQTQHPNGQSVLLGSLSATNDILSGEPPITFQKTPKLSHIHSENHCIKQGKKEFKEEN